MSELVQLRKKSQITLPQSIRQELGIEEGDVFDIKVRDGEIVLRAKKVIDKDQAWFWSRRWQAGERQAEEDIRAGRVQKFNDSNEAIGFLHKQTTKKSPKKNG